MLRLLSGNPELLTISLYPVLHRKLVTCDPVSMLFVLAPVVVFQKWMCRSWLPPPVARRLDCHGHHANAFTAARWFVFVNLGAARLRASQIETRLSLAPVASCAPSARHSRPQTSPVCDTSSATLCWA